jgi:hypothetical protein
MEMSDPFPAKTALHPGGNPVPTKHLDGWAPKVDPDGIKEHLLPLLEFEPQIV